MEKEYIRRVEGLGKLSKGEKQDFIRQILSSPSSKIFSIWQQAEEKHKNRGGNKEENDDKDLQIEIQKTILEIEEELNKEPKIIRKELKSRKKEILDDIQDTRQRKSQLDGLVKESIQQVKEELAKEPPIGLEDLDNPN
ncbi:6932_t:CDS:2 [Ambispora leptoticha]|uniref:6932_t:CDS:1 n=1 Tax=Ambispora leptoticha TaxID=144679 RepID=A0A9N8YP44_9GLOM|nr:6932_t:CDS:2 [Ambispora leptoticha]